MNVVSRWSAKGLSPVGPSAVVIAAVILIGVASQSSVRSKADDLPSAVNLPAAASVRAGGVSGPGPSQESPAWTSHPTPSGTTTTLAGGSTTPSRTGSKGAGATGPRVGASGAVVTPGQTVAPDYPVGTEPSGSPSTTEAPPATSPPTTTSGGHTRSPGTTEPGDDNGGDDYPGTVPPNYPVVSSVPSTTTTIPRSGHDT
jgi:hypothetical protein